MARQRSNISNVNPADIDIDNITRRLEANINKINNYQKKRVSPSSVTKKVAPVATDTPPNTPPVAEIPPVATPSPPSVPSVPSVPNGSTIVSDPLKDLRQTYAEIKERARDRGGDRYRDRDRDRNRNRNRGRDRDSGRDRDRDVAPAPAPVTPAVDVESISELKRNYEGIKDREDGRDKTIYNQQASLSSLQKELENVKNRDLSSLNKELSEIASRDREREKEIAIAKDREIEREREKAREIAIAKDREIEREREKAREIAIEKDREIERERERAIEKEREIEREREKEKAKGKEKLDEFNNQVLSDMREKDLANQINDLKSTINKTENDKRYIDIANIKDVILSSSENKAVYLQKIVTTLENDRYNNIQLELAKLSAKLENNRYSGFNGLGYFGGTSLPQIPSSEGDVTREVERVKDKIRDIERQSSQGDSDLRNYLMSLERKFDSISEDIKKLKEENRYGANISASSSVDLLSNQLPSQFSNLEGDVTRGIENVKDKIRDIERQSTQGDNDLKNYLMSLERKFDSMLEDIKNLKEENKYSDSSVNNSSVDLPNAHSSVQLSTLESNVTRGMEDVKDKIRDMERQSTQGDNDLKNYLMSLERKFDSMSEDMKKLKEESNQSLNEHKVNSRLENIRDYLQERPRRPRPPENEQRVREVIKEEKQTVDNEQETIEVKEVKKEDFFDFLNIDEDKKKKSDIMLMADKDVKIQSEIADSPFYKNLKKKKINMLDEIYNLCLNEAKSVPAEVKKLNPKIQEANLQTIANSRFLKASYGKILTLFNKNVSPDTLFADLAENGNRVIDAKYIGESAQKVSLVGSVRRINIRDIKNISCIILCKAGRNYAILGDGKYYDPYQNTVKDFKVEDFIDQYFGYAIFFNETILSVSSFLKKTAQIFDTIKEHKALFIEMVAISFIINVFALASPFFTTNVYDRVIPNNATDTMIVLATGMFLVYIFDFVFKSVKTYISEYISSNIGVNIDKKLMGQLLKEKAPGINLTSALKINVFKEVSTIREFYFSKFIPSMIEIPFVLLFIFVLFMISPLMALIPFVGGILILITNIMMQVPMQKSHSIMMQNDHRRNSVLTETILSSSAVKVFNGIGRKLSIWSRVLDTYYLSSFKHNLWISVAGFASIMIMSAASLFVLIVGVYETRAGNVTVGGIIAANILVSRILSPLVSFSGLIVRYRNIQQIMSSVQKVFSEPQEDESDNNTSMKGPFAGGVSFKDVTFFYPQQKIPVLNKVSFNINPREKVAIIGKTGAGKSTIVRLITKLDIPNTGRVMIDEFDVDAIYSTELRSSIGYLPQQSYFFQGTLRDNILLSDKTVSDEDYDKACTLAGVHEITSLYSKGDDMLIQEGGSNLSGGQKQIVALARAIIHQPPIIIMDEPTNGMDNSLEKAFMKNVLNYIKDKTFILITHKISQLSLVERVIFLEKGSVLLDGKTNEVMETISKVTE